jgi:hypothetical protein
VVITLQPTLFAVYLQTKSAACRFDYQNGNRKMAVKKSAGCHPALHFVLTNLQITPFNINATLC